MNYLYHAELASDPDGGFLVTFPDVPEAITHGETEAKAVESAVEALGLALRGYAAKGRALPGQRFKTGRPVAVEASDAMKLAVIEAFREARIAKTELARRLGRGETEARRILDPDHPTKIGLMQEALRVLGRRMSIVVEAA